MLHHCGAMLSGLDGGMEGGLAMMRSRDGKPFEKDSIAVLTLLAPHLRRALNTSHALHLARNRIEALRQSVEAIDVALLGLDSAGRVVRISPDAEVILNLDEGIRLEGGFLRAAVPSEQLALSQLIAGAVATGAGRSSGFLLRCSTANAPEAGGRPVWTPPSGGAMLISRRPPGRPLRLVVTPIRANGDLLGEHTAALVFLSDPDTMPRPRAALFRSLYGLTPVESRLADLLFQGEDLTAAAEKLRMSVGTARFHLKSIFRKTGVARQTDLVRLALSLPSISLTDG